MACVVTSIINMKGGVGKTTITTNLSYFLAHYKNKKVLLIDLDPQANLSSALLKYEKYESLLEERKVISEIFTDINKLVGPVTHPTAKVLNIKDLATNVYTSEDSKGLIDIIPSELELSSVLERSGGPAIEVRLEILLRGQKEKYDYILIDCSPTFSVLTTNALQVSNNILIPVKPDPFSARGIPMLLSKIEQHNIIHSDAPVDILGIVFNMVKENLAYMDSVKASILLKQKNVFKTELLATEHYPKGLLANKTIFDGNSQTHFKDNFINFCNEYLEKVGDTDAKK